MVCVLFSIKKFWEVVGDDISLLISQILNENKDLMAYNNTLITFIPKLSWPDYLKDFRSIRLCNVIMRIVSKCIANILKLVLHDLINY